MARSARRGQSALLLVAGCDCFGTDGTRGKKPVSSLGYRSNAAIPILSADKMRGFNAAFFLGL